LPSEHCQDGGSGKPRRASRQPRACFASKSVAPCRRPITRPVTTKGTSIRLSSLARARSSHRANKKTTGAAAAVWERANPHDTPPRHQNAFPPPPFKKRSRVAAPFDQESQKCPIQGKANNGKGADAPYFNRVRNGGLILARNTPSIVQPVCACQCIARPVSLCAPH
jgi:hypothetical protein